jgi:hypothetical protein
MMLMSRNRFIICSLAVLGALVMALVGLPGRNHSDLNLPAVYGETPCYKPVVPMDDLMDAVDENFEAISDQLKIKKYSKAMKAAHYVAEFCNVLQFHTSEEVEGAANMKKWKEISISIRDDMMKVAMAIKKKDAAGAKKILSAVEDSCESCHDMRD